ncbi:MAG: transglycosylase SLT domain-containing protein [Balneolaceae bacterium]|nr:transglycosylase SLT domain-containing protein [Balneolaceae bacterium]
MLKLSKYKPYYEKAAGILLILLFSIGLSSFISINHITHTDTQNHDPLKFENSEPLYFDFEEILKRGTIRMITQYTYSTYFLYQGMDRGFEYEFVSRFAEVHGLKVEVVFTHFDDKAIEMLNRGEGDLIAKNFAVFSERALNKPFSESYETLYTRSGNHRTNSHYVPEDYSSSGSEIVILEEDNFSWTMRINAPELKKKADEFLQKHLRYRETDSQFLRSAYPNLLRRHNLEDENLINRFRSSNYDIIYAGYLSPYDEMIKDIAEEAEVDWKLVVAVMAQESSFNPDAESVAGALGLMQIIPRFSLIENEELLYDPETNIREGVRYLKKHLENNAHLDSLNRYSMALATYNVGSGNISDAKRLAVQLGNNPDEWIYIAEALLKLMHPEYYEDARYGYKRGTETVNYVKAVLNRYSEYHTVNQWAGHLED